MHDTYPLTKPQLEQLLRPLNPARIAHRSQGGTQLSYLEAWDIRASLTRIFGFGNWSSEVLESEVLRIDVIPASTAGRKDQWRVLAKATVRLTIHQTGAVYTETAAQSQSLPDIGEATDMALKTVESDALKRVAINLGTQFGLSLYNNGETADVIRVVLDPIQQATLAEKVETDDPADAVAPAETIVLPVNGSAHEAVKQVFARD